MLVCVGRSRIETLQVYRQNGITTLAEGIEFDKARQRRQEEVRLTAKTPPEPVPGPFFLLSLALIRLLCLYKYEGWNFTVDERRLPVGERCTYGGGGKRTLTAFVLRLF